MAIAAGTVPGIDSHQMLILLMQLSLLLAVAVVLGRLAVRLNLPPVVGELAAGLVLGPSLLGQLAPGFSHWLLPQDPDQMHMLGAVGQVGVLLLVAITGAHIDLGLMRRRRRAIAWVSMGSVLLPLAVGFGLGLALPGVMRGAAADRTTFALFIGVAVAVSALPVIAKTLLDMRLLHRNIGQIIIGTAAASDILAWLLLSVVSAMAGVGLRAAVIAESIAYLILVLAATVFLARPLFGWILRTAERSAGAELSLPVIVVMITLAAAGTHALGMEPIVGAFLCGMVIGSLGPTSSRSLDSIRTFVTAVLAPLFLATAGLQVDLAALSSPAVALAAAVTLVVAIGAKLAGGYLGARAGRLSRREALAVGAGLNARGVVEIVLASVGLRLNVLSPASYTVIVLVAVVTSVMAPPILRRTTDGLSETPAEAEREAKFIRAPAS